MSRPSDTTAIQYYDDHAQAYIKGTVNVAMTSLYGPFLELIPSGGRILDAGCGSGRDAKAFLELGYEVGAIDGSRKMVEATSRLIGKPAQQILFQEMEFEDEFDGIWACASLLHVPLSEIDDVLVRFQRALRPGGAFFMSFKEGTDEQERGGRQFTDFTPSGLNARLAALKGFHIVNIWTTDDLRPDRDDRWTNALVRTISG